MTLDISVVRDLREQAKARAAARPKTPAVADVQDVEDSGTRMRRYLAHLPPSSEWVAVFAHGGYFVFGDLDLQDQYCRRLALAIDGEVISVDYALAPEHTAADSITDIIDAVTFARRRSSRTRLLLCGDSAGGAAAFLAAVQLRDARTPVDAVFLTNPNADLTMASFDQNAPAGPDPELSRRAIRAWAGPDPVASGLSPLHVSMQNMPPTFVAVGELDALRPEAVALHEALHGARTVTDLMVLDGVGHGFVGGATALEAAARDAALQRLERFL